MDLSPPPGQLVPDPGSPVPAPESARKTATERIVRVIGRKMRRESRSGSQPNLSEVVDGSCVGGPFVSNLHTSPSIPNLQFAKLDLTSRIAPSISTVPIALRGSPDGASIRSESPIPSCESHEKEDNVNDLSAFPPPRLIHHGLNPQTQHHHHPPPRPPDALAAPAAQSQTWPAPPPRCR